MPPSHTGSMPVPRDERRTFMLNRSRAAIGLTGPIVAAASCGA
jgi:hypothetical protein